VTEIIVVAWFLVIWVACVVGYVIRKRGYDRALESWEEMQRESAHED